MKELVLQKDIDNKIITTYKTKWNDVIQDDSTIIFCVGKNTRACYIAQPWNKTNECELITPYFGRYYHKNVFENLYELQQFYNVFLFDSLSGIDEYMNKNSLIWGKGGN